MCRRADDTSLGRAFIMKYVGKEVPGADRRALGDSMKIDPVPKGG